jgi:hypothetical protein
MRSGGSFRKIVFFSTLILLGAVQQVKADPVGALIGGIAGAQFGQGNGKLAMAIIGAVAGDVVTNQVSDVPSGYGDSYGYQTTHYAPPVYSYGPSYYQNPAPRVYYNPPVVPQVYYPAPVYRQPYESYRRDDDRWHEARRHRENGYREYREHDYRRDWR